MFVQEFVCPTALGGKQVAGSRPASMIKELVQTSLGCESGARLSARLTYSDLKVLKMPEYSKCEVSLPERFVQILVSLYMLRLEAIID